MATKSRSSSLLFTLITLLAILFCIRLGFWQFDRYEFRQEISKEITAALDQDAIELNATNQKSADAWMKVSVSGEYDSAYQKVFRGHYFQERYGLEVLSLFIPADTEVPPIWVDRGWIETNRSAAAISTIPLPPQGPVTISGILRQYDDPKATKGVFFALPAPRIGRIDEISLQESFSGETFHKYLKLQGAPTSSDLAITPLIAPGTGPHLAYAIQWWIFALLIAGTRIALFKSERAPKNHEEN